MSLTITGFREHLRRLCWLGAGILIAAMTVPAFGGENGDDGWVALFDGETLENWDGNPEFWRVEDGAITGQTTEENPTEDNTFLIWRGGKLEDFELKLEYRIIGGNSGIQYRSFEIPDQKWVVGGYQADIDSGDTFSGILYGERFRGILANRGQKTVLKRSGDEFEVDVVEQFADPEKLQSHVKKEAWNDYHIIARGHHFVHKINGQVMSECTDRDEKMRRDEGILALQLHAGPPMKVQFRNIRLKRLEPAGQKTGKVRIRVDDPDVGVFVDEKRVRVSVGDGVFDLDLDLGEHDLEIRRGERTLRHRFRVRRNRPTNLDVDLGEGSVSPVTEKKRILFIAGRPSHGYGSHEHRAGCLLLARELNESGLPVQAEVHAGGWPEDPAAFESVDSIVIYADGGGGHPALDHLDQLQRLMNDGVGLACIHYAVEVPKGEPGDKWLDWIGGYFETHWSVNPHWTATFEELPGHEIARGVEPFSIRDEWYYHMRLRTALPCAPALREGERDTRSVKSLLRDLPPKETLNRPDGAHSNNPHVREALLERKEPQHVAWAYERKDGGRGFGFTGGHFHWNWGHDDFRRLVLNAIVWTAGLEVPEDGVPTEPLTADDLLANQDYDPPENFDPEAIRAKLEEWNR